LRDWLVRGEGEQCWSSGNQEKLLRFERQRLTFAGDDCYNTASLYKILLAYVTVLVEVLWFKCVNKSSVKSCFIIGTSDFTFIVILNSIYQSVFVLSLILLACYIPCERTHVASQLGTVRVVQPARKEDMEVAGGVGGAVVYECENNEMKKWKLHNWVIAAVKVGIRWFNCTMAMPQWSDRNEFS
jgi:hypothetical protein